MEETISLQEIFQVIKKRFVMIVSITVGAALIAAVLSFFILTPVYESSSQFIVNQTEQDQERMELDKNEIQSNVELINTYNVVLKSKAILSEVIDELNLDMTASQLSDKIEVSSEEDSQVVNVSVKDPDPQLATTIANTTVEVFQAEIVDIMNVDNVSVLSEAEMDFNPSPVEPRPTLNIAIALVLGAMIGVGIAFLLEYFDTTIRTEEDLEEKLGITIIGTVSTMDASDVQGGQRSRATNVKPTQPNEGRRSHAKAE